MEKQRMSKKKRTVIIVLCCIAALLLALLIAGFILWKTVFGQMGRLDATENTLSSQEESMILNEGNQETVGEDFTGPSYNAQDVTVPTEPVENVSDSENVIHILLVGQDRRSGQSRQRSDAMILCTINKAEKTLVFTSFLRDTWVSIPGYYNERLNVPYALKGFGLLNDTLEHNFGVRADYNVEVDFSGFEQIIDAVGGVSVSLTSAEAYHLNNMGFGWSLTEGVNLLNGQQALRYSRIRKLDSDFGRTNRQRTVLNSLVETAKHLSATRLYELVNTLLPMVRTDMTDSDIAKLMVELLPILPDLQITNQSIPYGNNYQFASIDGKSVIVLDGDNLQKNLDRLKETIGDE